MNFQFKKKIGFFLSPSSLLRTYRAVRNAKKILELGNYREKCRERGIFIEDDTNLWNHYKDIGFKINIDPCGLFDSAWYRSSYLIKKPNDNPLLHYLIIGERKGQNTNPLLKPKAIFEILSEKTPRHKSYLLGLMEEYGIKQYSDFYKLDVSIIKQFLKIDNAHIFNIKNAFSYLIENKMDYTLLDKETFLDKDCSFFTENPFFGYNMPYYTMFKNVEIIADTADILIDETNFINDELYYSNKVRDTYGDPIKDLIHHNMFENFFIIKNIKKSIDNIEEGIHLTKEYNANYFHFIFEVLTKFSYMEDNNIFPDDIPILISGNLHENMYKMLDIINIKKRKIIKLDADKRIFVKKLYYLSDITLIANSYDNIADKNVTILPKAVLDSLRDKIVNNIVSLKPKTTNSKDKIYLSRKHGARIVLNESTVEQYLIENGFETVDTQNLSFADQVLLFSQAHVIMGPTGAAMANLLWCSPNTKVVIFYPEHPFNNMSFWIAIAKAVGIDLTIIKGKSVGDVSVKYPHCNYIIDINVIKNTEII